MDERERKSGVSPSVIRRFLLLLVVLAVPLFRFYEVVGFDFVSFDDGLHIFGNPRMRAVSKETVAGFWKKPYQNLYVPVSYTFWSLLAVIGKTDDVNRPFSPSVFHLADLILHLINTLLLYAILLRFVKKDWAAAVGALIFSLHPVQIESVAWISEFRGLLSATFGFGAVLLFLAETRREPRHAPREETAAIAVSSALSSFLFLCALLSKPSAIVFPLVAAILSFHPGIRRRHLVVLGTWIALALPIVFVTGREQASAGSLPVWLRTFVFSDAVGFYASKTAVPISLCIDYGRTPLAVMNNYVWLPTTMLAIGATVLALTIRKKEPLAFRSFLVFVSALLPVSGLVPFLFQDFSTVADRYLYVPMLGTALCAAALLSKTRRRSVVVLLGGWAVATVSAGERQLHTWENSSALYAHALKINPHSVLGLNNLGNAYFEKGEYQNALLSYKKAIVRRPAFAKAYYNCGKVFFATGNNQAAINFCARSLFYGPENSEVHELLGRTYSRLGQSRTAIDNFKRAVELGDSSAEVCVSLGMAYRENGGHDSAAVWFLAAAGKSACPFALYNAIALEYAALGETTAAIHFFSKAVSCNPREVIARLNRGRVFKELGRREDAVKDFSDVIAVDPGNAYAQSQLAELRNGATGAKMSGPR
jgi:protein O-mannosyl-transferase